MQSENKGNRWGKVDGQFVHCSYCPLDKGRHGKPWKDVKRMENASGRWVTHKQKQAGLMWLPVVISRLPNPGGLTTADVNTALWSIWFKWWGGNQSRQYCCLPVSYQFTCWWLDAEHLIKSEDECWRNLFSNGLVSYFDFPPFKEKDHCIDHKSKGDVHILRQPKSGVSGPPPTGCLCHTGWNSNSW